MECITGTNINWFKSILTTAFGAKCCSVHYIIPFYKYVRYQNDLLCIDDERANNLTVRNLEKLFSFMKENMFNSSPQPSSCGSFLRGYNLSRNNSLFIVYIFSVIFQSDIRIDVYR